MSRAVAKSRVLCNYNHNDHHQPVAKLRPLKQSHLVASQNLISVTYLHNLLDDKQSVFPFISGLQ